MAAHFPRLMVATEFAPNASGGGPAVVRQMLQNWPPENLFWWSCLPERNQSSGQRVALHRVANIPSRLYPNRRLASVKSWLLENLWAPRATRQFRDTLNAINPHMLWVIPHGWAIPPLASVLPGGKRRFHTTVQDYMDARRYVSRFGIERSRRLADQSNQLYASAASRDATSHPMIADLQARTGRDAAQMLHAGVEESDFDYLTGKSSRPRDSLRIAYAGTIIVENDFALLARVLGEIRLAIRFPITLEFFGAHSYRSQPWFDAGWMREQGNLPETELIKELRNCAWGISLMEFSDADPRYNRFSFPTKFITYLAAGLPVITLGHPESSVVKMAKAYQVGVCITSPEPSLVRNEISTALSIEQPWKRFGQEILRCARTEFDAQRMRKILYDCLCKDAFDPRNSGSANSR